MHKRAGEGTRESDKEKEGKREGKMGEAGEKAREELLCNESRVLPA